MTSSKVFLLAGGLNGMLAVLIGAFGAHLLKNTLTEHYARVFETGSQYHYYHALGLLLIGILAGTMPTSALIKWSGWLMLSGLIIFSGSLYVLAITQLRWIGAITPLGGSILIIAWLILVIAIARS